MLGGALAINTQTRSTGDILSITDIAVLKSEVAGLHTAIDEISGKIDLVLSMRVELSVQNERLERSIEDGRKSHEGIYKDLGALTTRLDNVSTHSMNTRKKLDAWLNRGIGGFAVGTFLMGIIQYAIVEKVDRLSELSTTVETNRVELGVVGKAISAHISSTELRQLGGWPYKDVPPDEPVKESGVGK